ncbi:unnamed protein product, partial [Brassica napus]
LSLSLKRLKIPTMSGENWTHVAMSDDSLVADALLQLRHSEPMKKSNASLVKLKWSVRQRRSRKGDQTRASPTTPLSLSDAMSLSGGGGVTTVEGLEESSATVKPSETVRSKVSQTGAITPTTLFKRSRKKKTLAELKDEEVMLLKESKCLKNELARMRDLVEEQRTRNNALKKMKAESQSALSCKRSFQKGSSFLLPDLNMPLDTDMSPERRYLSGARFLSETPTYRIVGADHCRYSSRDESVGRLVVRNVKASDSEDDEVLEKIVPTDLMTPTGTIGASQGWVATLKDNVVWLQDDLNPFASDSSPKRISLPRPKTLPDCQTQMVTNVALSSSPEDEDCILAVKFVGPQLSLCRPAEKNNHWVNIRIEDPGFFSSRMFSMLGRGGTHTGSWDLENHRSRSFVYRKYKEYLPSEMEDMSRCSRSEHLVEAPTGQTFMVKWYTDIFWNGPDNGVRRWKRFMVFEVAGGDAIASNDIEELCIFLSIKGEPFCVEASLYGLTPNCIYYVGDFDYGKVNIGNNERVGGYGFSPAPYFIPPQSS